MLKKILFQIGFFLLEVGAGIMIRLVFGKENMKKLEDLIKELSFDSELSAKQKYNRAKKFLDEVFSDAPDTVKNIAIEAIVIKVTDKAQKVLQKIQ